MIGRGSLGRVFRAVNQETGQIIAVKEVAISPQEQEDEKFKATLENEVRIMRGLDHINVLKFFGHDYIDGSLYMYLEYMPAGTLSSALNEFGPFEEPLIMDYSLQLLHGVEYLHTRDPPVVHRDIKGGNILLGVDGAVKLADFGCSKRTDQTMTHTMRGSIPWMAPEVIAHSRYGRAADVWSFGCVVIEMCTAAVPWGRFDNQMAALVKIGLSQERPPLPEGASKNCRDFLMCCLQRDHTLRPSCTELFDHVFLRKDAP